MDGKMKRFLVIMAALWGFAISVVMTDYFLFRVAGDRFTATDGAELCEYVAQLRRLHGMTEPPCDYLERDR
jgi:hypothetical protein